MSSKAKAYDQLFSVLTQMYSVVRNFLTAYLLLWFTKNELYITIYNKYKAYPAIVRL